ncbi:hypothetical protein [Burkholderia multivorans]|uniref:hypothetical protein n=1 Tax=Burkholderia multivorans TaxID=87883 RepID=UPI00018E2845|nr:hypothetical protein [Burkholderia multivorans]EEE03065.1 hypothetical protein BURMUCGD1_4251 [Burkholderia multivorans CGD1]MBU9307489.1 hypothetical protein [Burkholderia multivorans]MBU9573796.1 hypothetical protein [Burkholderia multivorans]MDN7948267.1 hypothetical protein [Burkholderia multivorans]MDN7960769.1 hypothetical protein [Burkholderia multivorans]
MDSQQTRINRRALFGFHFFAFTPPPVIFSLITVCCFTRIGFAVLPVVPRASLDTNQTASERGSTLRRGAPARKRTLSSAVKQANFSRSACRSINEYRLIRAPPVLIASQI